MSAFAISIKNLKSFILKTPLIFVIFICCLAASTITLMYSVVLLQNVNSLDSSVEDDITLISINNSANLSSDEIFSRLSEFLASNENAVCYTTVTAFDENKNTYKLKAFIGNEKEMFDKVLENCSSESGRMLSENDFESKNPVCVMSGYYESVDKLYFEDKEISVIGRIIGKEQACYVPFGTVLGSDSYIEDFIVDITKDGDTAAKLKLYTKELKLLFPELSVYNNIDTERVSSLESIGFGAIAIILLVVISILNVSFLYAFIIRKRLREIIIFKICGSSVFGLVRVFLWELLLITAMQSLASVFLMKFLIVPVVTKYDVAFRYNFNSVSIAVSIIITAVISFLILIPYMIKYCRMSCIELKSKINN